MRRDEDDDDNADDDNYDDNENDDDDENDSFITRQGHHHNRSPFFSSTSSRDLQRLNESVANAHALGMKIDQIEAKQERKGSATQAEKAAARIAVYEASKAAAKAQRADFFCTRSRQMLSELVSCINNEREQS